MQALAIAGVGSGVRHANDPIGPCAIGGVVAKATSDVGLTHGVVVGAGGAGDAGK